MSNKPLLVERKTLSRKVVGAVGIGGAVATIVIFIINVWQPELIIPDEVAVALSTILAVAIGGWSLTESEDK